MPKFDRYHPLVPMIIAGLVAFKFLYNADMRVVGNDIMTHIYKVWLLSNQIVNLRWPFWGSWDPNWYCGYPYLEVYAPFFYYAAALLRLLFKLSSADAVKLLAFITFPLSSLTMYFCSQSITKNRLCSFISSLLYGLNPMHITSLTIMGTIYVLSFVFVPLVFLFTHKVLTEEGSNKTDLILASLFLAATILSHHGAGMALVALMFLFFVLYSVLLKGIRTKVFLIVPLSLLLSAFFVVPLVVYMLTYAYIVSPLSLPPVPPVHEMLKSFFLPISHVSLGLTSLVFGLLLPALLLLKRWREHKSIMVYFLTALCILIIYGFTRAGTWYILPLDTLARSICILPFFASILAGWCLSSLNKGFHRKLSMAHIVALVVVVMMLLEANFAGVYHPPSPDRYLKVYEYLENDTEWGRVFQVPSSPTMGAITMYGRKPIIDGSAIPPYWIQYFISKTISSAGGYLSLKGRGWGDVVNDAESVLNTLRIFGVKYVIVDSHETVYPLWVSERIFLNIKESESVDMVAAFNSPTDPYQVEHIHLFKLKEWYPIIVAPKAFVLDNLNETEEFYEIVSDKKFDPKSAIFLSKDNNLKDIPWTFWSHEETLNANYVNYTLQRFHVEDLTMSIVLKVDAASFAYIPVNHYYPGLKVVVNGKRVEPLRALPGFISLYFASGGTYSITISRGISLLEIVSLIISFATLGLLTLVFISNLRKSHLDRDRKTNGAIEHGSSTAQTLWDRLWVWKQHEGGALRGFYDEACFLIDENLDISPEILVLEPGCGSGRRSLILASKGANVVLLDASLQALKFAKKVFLGAGMYKRADLVLGDIRCLPFQHGCFDIVLNEGVIEHFVGDERQMVINEMVEKTKVGGRVAVVTPNALNLPYVFYKKYREKRYSDWIFRLEVTYNPEELRKRFSLAGLRILKSGGGRLIPIPYYLEGGPAQIVRSVLSPIRKILGRKWFRINAGYSFFHRYFAMDLFCVGYKTRHGGSDENCNGHSSL